MIDENGNKKTLKKDYTKKDEKTNEKTNEKKTDLDEKRLYVTNIPY